MTLQQLIYFKEVAETLHFTKAAQNLYVSQSALSYAISGLEHQLGVPLFVRESGKNVALTSFGQALLPMAEKAIKNFDEIEDAIQKIRNPMSGIVNIAYSYINGNRFIPKMFSKFNDDNAFKEISISFEINHSRTHFEDDVALGNLDLAFSCTPETEGLTVVPFARQELFVVMPPNHPLSGRERVTVDDIKNDVLLGYDQNRNLDRRVHEIFRSCGLKPNIDNYAHDWSEQLSLISLGMGIGIMPRLPFEPGLVKEVPLDHPLHTRDIYMMWANNRELPAAVRYVRDYCLTFYKEPPLV